MTNNGHEIDGTGFEQGPRIAASSERPVLIYDGECDFCRRWIGRWRHLTGESVEYAAYQEALGRFPQITEFQAREAVQLVLESGQVLQGAAAVCRTLRAARGWRWAHVAYERVPGFAWIAEWAYRTVARHRGAGGRHAANG